MKIVRPGRKEANPFHWITGEYQCPACECVFEIEDSDIQQILPSVNLTNSTCFCSCPTCGGVVRIRKAVPEGGV